MRAAHSNLCWGTFTDRSPDHIGLHDHKTAPPNMANARLGTRPYRNRNGFSYSCQEKEVGTDEEGKKTTKRLQRGLLHDCRQPSGDLVQLLKRVTCDSSPSMYAVDATLLRRGHLFRVFSWERREDPFAIFSVERPGIATKWCMSVFRHAANRCNIGFLVVFFLSPGKKLRTCLGLRRELPGGYHRPPGPPFSSHNHPTQSFPSDRASAGR